MGHGCIIQTYQFEYVEECPLSRLNISGFLSSLQLHHKIIIFRLARIKVPHYSPLANNAESVPKPCGHDSNLTIGNVGHDHNKWLPI